MPGPYLTGDWLEQIHGIRAPEVIGAALACAQSTDMGANVRTVRGKSWGLLLGTTITSIISKPAHIGKTSFYTAQLGPTKDASDISADTVAFRHQRPIPPVVLFGSL
jgi:hypothetical protein